MEYDDWLKEGETIEDLQLDGLKIIQKTRGFRFGMDAVLLAGFTFVEKGDSVLDLGTGTGIIPVLLAGKTDAKSISAVEIQSDIAEMASRSVRMNRLEKRIRIVCGDLKHCQDIFRRARFNVVTANPPYMNAGGGLINTDDCKAIARHELKCTLEDVIKAASAMLVHLGSLNMIHKPERLVDVMCTMRKHNVEPKLVRFVHPSGGKNPTMVLVRGMKDSKPYLKVMPPLFVYKDGEYSEEVMEIYRGGKKREVSKFER